MTKPWNSHRDQGPKTIGRGRRPRLDLREDRMLLATFTVTDTSDSVSETGSLHYAITQSNLAGPGPNVIDFDITGTGGVRASRQRLPLVAQVGQSRA
jgi:hypothetical protein